MGGGWDFGGRNAKKETSKKLVQINNISNIF